MAEDLKENRKEAMNEWLDAFPQLTVFTQSKLYKIVGCTIIGIELIKLPNVEKYRPHLVIYPLWKDDVKTCLDAPAVSIEVYNRKGLQFSIPYSKENIYLKEAIESIKNQVLTSGDVTLKSFFEMIDSYFNDILIKSNSAHQARLYELKFCAALYLGNENQVKNVLNQIQKEAKNWNMRMFEMWYGAFDVWFQNLQDRANDVSKFLDVVSANKQNSKLQKLKMFEFVL